MSKTLTDDLRAELEWCIADGNCGPRTRATLVALRALLAAQQPESKLAQAIHYPECWDTVAYPTVESALREVYAAFRCQQCEQPEPRAEVTDTSQIRRHWNPVYNTDPVQRACTELPDGYEIEIMLERDAGTVDVCGPDGGRLDVDFDEGTFDWKIHAAIDAAIDAARAGEGHADQA
ncbi:hypothetical protein KDW20_12025 [Burkholderia cenocepacia]|uniref:hypothetical protein n=1 Tax=Burkholderia cenocepacia TaxID=95486 RepID=UPI001B8F1B74|nr:hypothetical protein [Burkholderia cenocepacia]MBR8376505.1 hypothetical protein [Burkholderia cenocepacia]